MVLSSHEKIFEVNIGSVRDGIAVFAFGFGRFRRKGNNVG